MRALQSRIDQPLRYPSQYEDASTGLHYNALRCYDQHFRLGNESVYRRAQVDPEFRRLLQTKYPGVIEHVTPTSTGRFRGSSPPGMTWHHGDAHGSLKLVDAADHRSFHKVYHPDGTGGRNKWGGGTGCR